MCLHLKYILTRCIAPCRHMCDEWKHSESEQWSSTRASDWWLLHHSTSNKIIFPPSDHKCGFNRKLPAQTKGFFSPFFCGVLTLLVFQSDVPKRAAPLSRYTRQYARINEINVIVPKEEGGYPVLGGSAGGCLQRFVVRVSAQSQGASGRRIVLSAEISNLLPATSHQPFFRPDIPTLCRCRRRLPASLPASLLLLRMERKNDKNTWRCPDQSADSPAGYWLRAPVRHCRPSKAEHHLLRACCDENKDRRGRRGMGRRGMCGWGDGGWYMALRLEKKERKTSPLCLPH